MSDLAFAEGASRGDAPDGDALEALWRTYYASIFNPARLKVAAMRAEMPKKYWRNLPEAPLIRPLIAEASKRAAVMAAAEPLAPKKGQRLMIDPAPERANAGAPIETLREAVEACRACPLWAPATQTVFGEGPPTPASWWSASSPATGGHRRPPLRRPGGQGCSTGRAEAAGIERAKIYVTNAVKHFKFEPRGKRRIHQKPDRGEIDHCRWWLAKEIELIKPRLIVALGATALYALSGEQRPLNQVRGKPITMQGDMVLYPTIHPSYLLRLPDVCRNQA
jgi:uracil-DNA glycosylase family protein